MLRAGLCPEYSNHVLPNPSGFCTGKHQCEGTKPRSPSGKPMKVCTQWLRCPCDCHERITQMYLLAERERKILDNPDYVPVRSIVWMPSLEEIQEMRAAKARDKKQDAEIEKSDDELVPDRIVVKFAPTESGRAARGQLEQQVEEACGAWLKGDREEACSTAWVAAWIDSEYGMQPSRGAIDAVWNRWVLYSFCMKGTNPTQFFGFTKAGREKGLATMRDEYKRKAKNGQRAVALGRTR